MADLFDMFMQLVLKPLLVHGPRKCILFIRRITVGDAREQRGFEVKPITGETPVLREKENDHG